MRNEYQELAAQKFNFQLTAGMINRLTEDWRRIAKEKISIEYMNGFIYADGSELAMLRLVAAYRNSKKTHYRSDKPNSFSLDISDCFISH